MLRKRPLFRSVIAAAVLLTLLGIPPTSPEAAPLNEACMTPDAQTLLDLTNQARAAAGVAPLKASCRLIRSAQTHTSAMAQAGQLMHQLPSELPQCAVGPNNDRYDAIGYLWLSCGENIASGSSSFNTPQAVHDAWMTSSGHRDNILRPEFKEMGAAHAVDGRGTNYWTEDFGASTEPACSMTGDLNGNGAVDASDIQAEAGHWRAAGGSTYDLNRDGRVDVGDVLWLSSRLNQACP
ncbi:MAG: CAP domain-containing protein [Anaerolineae bacterium]